MPRECEHTVAILVRRGEENVSDRVERWRKRGWSVRVVQVDDLESRAPRIIPRLLGDGPCERSERIRRALEREAFSVIEFPTLGGLGHRAIQAKKAGLAFADTSFVVYLDVISEWLRQREGRWPNAPEHLEGDFAERYAFENACAQIVRSGELLDHLRRCGWSMERASDDVPTSRLAGEMPVAHLDATSPLVSLCVPYFNLPHTLPETLESLHAQTYAKLEVIVIDDGSTQPQARRVFDAMREKYPDFRFLRQQNAGIGATRNRGLFEARGEFFLPFDADNVARPDMVECFVQAIRRRPDVSALTCYFQAFATSEDLRSNRFLHAFRPTGGPHVLSCLRNVYGDATAIYRTEAFRSVGGYETDRGSSFEDWEAFVKLVHAGHRLDVVPECLFFYRHLPTGFSRVTNPYANQLRVVRQFHYLDQLPHHERMGLWNLLQGIHLRLEQLDARQNSFRYRLVDRLHAAYRRLVK